MTNKILFSIPDFYNSPILNLRLIDLMSKYPYKFNDNVVIDNVYGSFPCIWNGGRYLFGNISLQDEIHTVKLFNSRNVGIRFTFTNSLIKEIHLLDTNGNNILKNSISINPRNSITVNQKIFMDYINKYYPEYYCVWSTTLGLTDIDKINELSKNNIVVLDYSLNNNFDSLKKLKYPENIEILVNEVCELDCPFRKDHYLAISQFNMGYSCDHFSCKIPKKDHYTYERYLQDHRNMNLVDFNAIVNNYLSLGINKFKIEGRGDSDFVLIERYIDYLVKPEFRDDVRFNLISYIYKNIKERNIFNILDENLVEVKND